MALQLKVNEVKHEVDVSLEYIRTLIQRALARILELELLIMDLS